MKAIWKFPLGFLGRQEIEMPTGAKPLTVQTQGGSPCLWAIVDPEAGKVRRIVHLYGTGHPAPDALDPNDYIGTFQMHGGELVFHVFIY